MHRSAVSTLHVLSSSPAQAMLRGSEICHRSPSTRNEIQRVAMIALLVTFSLVLAPTGAASGATLADGDVALTASAAQAGASGSTQRVWPWIRWYRSGISPQFAYRQVIQTGLRGRGRQRLEIRTRYRFVPQRVSRRWANVDIVITGVDVYRRGRFVGSIRRLPASIRRTRVLIRRNGRVRLDREVAVIGGGGLGYELLALRPGGAWRRPVVLSAARVNVRQGRAVPIRRSSLTRGRHGRFLTPIPLLPADVGDVSQRLLRYEPAYYEYSRPNFGYEPPHAYGFSGRFEQRFEGRFDDDRFDEDRFDDRYDDRFDDDRFEGENERRLDRPGRNPLRNDPDDIRRVPRNRNATPRQDRRTPFRVDVPPSSQVASNSERRRGARESHSARASTPETSRRSPLTSRTRSTPRAERGSRTGRSSTRSENGREATAMRRAPETIRKHDTRTVRREGSEVRVERETKLTRLDDYEE